MSAQRSQAWIDAMARIADEAVPLGPEKLQRLNAILSAPSAPAGTRDITHKRRLSKALDTACGVEKSAPAEGLDRYGDSALSWEQREAAGLRRSA